MNLTLIRRNGETIVLGKNSAMRMMLEADMYKRKPRDFMAQIARRADELKAAREPRLTIWQRMWLTIFSRRAIIQGRQ